MLEIWKDTKTNLNLIQDFKTFFVELPLLTIWKKMGVELAINNKGLDWLTDKLQIKKKVLQKNTDGKQFLNDQVGFRE